MAKIIKYKFVSAEINRGTEEEPEIEQVILGASLNCKTQIDYDANYSIAEMEAIEGTIEISGEFDDITLEPTQLDRIESQVAYLAMMTGNEEILEV